MVRSTAPMAKRLRKWLFSFLYTFCGPAPISQHKEAESSSGFNCKLSLACQLKGMPASTLLVKDAWQREFGIQ